MAKLMDVLKKREILAEPPGLALAKETLVQETRRCAESEAEVEEAYPYIEIDGLTRTLAGSPDVMPATVSLPADKKPEAQAPPVPSPSRAHSPVWERGANAANAADPSRSQTGVWERGANERGANGSALVYEPWPTAATADPARIAPELVVFHNPESAASRQYVQLLEQLLQSERPPQAMMFTARNAGNGLVIPVLNLAIAACQQKHRKVAVLGMEGKQPSVSSCLGLLSAPELHQVLEGRIALEQAMQASPIANLTALAIGGGPHSAAVWGRDALRWVVSWLRNRFHLVFFDVGVWRGTPEQVLLANLCDAVYPFLPEGDCRQPEIQQFIQSILAQGGPVRGLLNVRA